MALPSHNRRDQAPSDANGRGEARETVEAEGCARISGRGAVDATDSELAGSRRAPGASVARRRSNGYYAYENMLKGVDRENRSVYTYDIEPLRKHRPEAPKVTHLLPDVMTDSEWQAFIGTFNKRCATGLRNAAMFSIMHQAGLRTCEVLGLKTADVRREDGAVALDLHVTKGGKQRRVWLDRETADLLDRWMDARSGAGLGHAKHVFTTLKGATLKDSYLRELAARKGEEAGIGWRVHPHALRHTAATNTLKRTGNLALVQDMLGHARPETTRVYAKIANEDLREAMTGETGRTPADPEADELAAKIMALNPEARAALKAILG
jgi:site-specific recombinase XerD